MMNDVPSRRPVVSPAFMFDSGCSANTFQAFIQLLPPSGLVSGAGDPDPAPDVDMELLEILYPICGRSVEPFKDFSQRITRFPQWSEIVSFLTVEEPPPTRMEKLTFESKGR